MYCFFMETTMLKLKKKACAEVVAKQVASGELIDIKGAMKKVGLRETFPKSEIVTSTEFKERLSYHLEKMDSLLELSYEKAKQKSEEGSFRDHIVAIDTLTKNKRLLDGKSTENVSISAVLDALEEDDYA